MSKAQNKPTNTQIVAAAAQTFALVLILGYLPIPFVQGAVRFIAQLLVTPTFVSLLLVPVILGVWIGTLVVKRPHHTRTRQSLSVGAMIVGWYFAGLLGSSIWPEHIR